MCNEENVINSFPTMTNIKNTFKRYEGQQTKPFFLTSFSGIFFYH